jgi:SAM-dependent methyltransferase
MTAWSGGYVADIEYSAGFYIEQMPSFLDAACLVRGVEPPVARGAPFTYCELGCGIGETAMVVAATNPQAKVWAFDFNPAHIARGLGLARAGGLDNFHLEERSFAELVGPDAPDMPLFDYVTLHGVWTWVSPENQSHIVRFLARHVRPGGVVCISYNALPGWAPIIPLQKLLYATTRQGPGRSDEKVRAAIALCEAVSKAGGPGFDIKAVEGLQNHLNRPGGTAYLVHEYLNEHWQPVFQTDVAAALSAAKLEYAATANMLENFPALCVTGEQQQIIDRAPPELRELMKDYFMTRPFRRDIYIRGRRTISDHRLSDRLRAQRLTLVVPPSTITHQVAVPLGQAELHPRFYAPAFKAFTDAVLPLGEVLDLPEAAGSTVTAQEALGMTIGSRQVLPAPNDITEEGLARVRAFNLAHLRVCAEEGRPLMALAGLAIGSGVTIRLFEMLAYEALATGTSPDMESVAQAAAATLRRRGDRLRREQQDIDDPEETLGLLRTNMADVLANALPMWRRIGAI